MSDTHSDSTGHLLREMREKKGLGLEEVEKATRIRAKFLAALEEDDYATLPSATQARGFLALYANFLGLDAAEIIGWYDAWRNRPRMMSVRLPLARPVARPTLYRSAEQAAAPRPPTRPASERAFGRPPQVRSRRPRWLSPDVFVGVTFTVVLGIFLVWGALEFSGGAGFTPTGTPTRAATPVVKVASATLPVDATSTEPLPTPLAVYNGVDIIVRAEQRTWVSVAVDGAEAFAGLMPPGASKEFNGQTVVELSTGNGQGTHVIWNGRDQGTLGQIGEAVIRLWTRDGALTPTPTITPIPSKTSVPTATPKP